MERLTTQEDLESIRKRAEAAAEGPWGILEGYNDRHAVIGETSGTVVIAEFHRLESAYFTAKARTDIPALLAEVERLRDGMSEICEIVDDFYSEHSGIRLPAYLAPKAGEIRAIHTIALEAIRND